MAVKTSFRKAPKSKYTPQDLAILAGLLELKVLEPIDSAHLLPDSKRQQTTIIACSDCHQCNDLFCTHHKAWKSRLHQRLLLNGGAFWLSTALKDKEAKAKRLSFMIDIEGTLKIKSIKTVVLYGHAPCGAAAARGFTLLKLLEHVYLGKEHLKEHFAGKGLRFVCFFHVDHEGKKKQTYFFNRANWLANKSKLEEIAKAHGGKPETN